MRSAGGLSMIASLSLILLCQLAGEVIVRGFALPVPGPVVGLMLLLLLLLARDRFAPLARGPLQGGGVETASRGLLANLSLLFIPGRRRRGAEARPARRTWHRHHRRARDLGGRDPARNGHDLSLCEPPHGPRRRPVISENPFSLWV
jgi:hypothetical protein